MNRWKAAWVAWRDPERVEVQTVWMPPGEYWMTGPLRATRGVRLEWSDATFHHGVNFIYPDDGSTVIEPIPPGDVAGERSPGIGYAPFLFGDTNP